SQAAATQLPPRISHRKKRSPWKGFNSPRRTTNDQPAPAEASSQIGRDGGAPASSSSSAAGGNLVGAAAVRADRLRRGGVRPTSVLDPGGVGGPSRFHSPRANAATRASRAQNPPVAQTSRKRLCGSWISSLACGSLYWR